MGAYMGLAVPLAGEYTQTTSAGTVTGFTDDYGYTTVTLAQTSAYMTAMSPGGVEGIRYRLNVTGDTTGSSTAAFWLDHDDGDNTGQLYAAEFWVTGSSDAGGIASGQLGNINLVSYLDASYAGVTAHNAGFISIGEFGSTKMPCLFQMSNFTADAAGSIFYAADNTVIDHALRISISSTTYYIGLYDALCT